MINTTDYQTLHELEKDLTKKVSDRDACKYHIDKREAKLLFEFESMDDSTRLAYHVIIRDWKRQLDYLNSEIGALERRKEEIMKERGW